LSKTKARKIEVEIYDQVYSVLVTAPLEEPDVRQLAEDLDARMRQIAAATNTADSLKVAVLTALHLAQEYRDLQQKCAQKTYEWSAALEQVLKK
jgi:cell division protein ZapA (FtsZ GTPase activity inhibitor)